MRALLLKKRKKEGIDVRKRMEGRKGKGFAGPMLNYFLRPCETSPIQSSWVSSAACSVYATKKPEDGVWR